MPTMEWVAGYVPPPLPLPAPIDLAAILAFGQPSLAADVASRQPSLAAEAAPLADAGAPTEDDDSASSYADWPDAGPPPKDPSPSP
jgi:hypothetical protein